MILKQLARLTKWMIVVALVVAMLPTAFLPKSHAQWHYFQPDIGLIAGSSNLVPGAVGGILPNTGQVDRSRIYISPNISLNMVGNFSGVSQNGINVKVDQFNFTGSVWEADATRSYTRAVTTVGGSASRFTANGLDLYPGVNRITMSGLQGTNLREDVFYVLYDSAPYLKKLEVVSGPDTYVSNAGSPIVVSTETIALMGESMNATEITVQGRSYTPAPNSGSFFFAGILLKQGKNELQFSIRNSENTAIINRTIYYYAPTAPYTSLVLKHDTEVEELLYRSSLPTLTKTTVTAGVYEKANLAVQVLVPATDVNTTFASAGSVSVNGVPVDGSVLSYASIPTETNILGPDGNTLKYKLVKFEISNIPFTGAPQNHDQLQVFNISVTYDNSTPIPFPARFRYLPGDISINKMYLLPGYTASSNIDTIKEPLNDGAVTEVNNSSFYVLTETSAAPGAQLLTAKLLPMQTGLTITKILTIPATGAVPDREVYQITGFPSGQQNIQFKYDESVGTYTTGITYSSKAFISTNIYDGQAFSFSSAATNSITVTGSYVNFDRIATDSDTLSINGISHAFTLSSASTFNISLTIGASNGLIYGENKLIFNGINIDGTGAQTVLTKEVRIFIIDTNIPTIEKFIPTGATATGMLPINQGTLDYTPSMEKLFAATPDIQRVDSKYTTTKEKYSLLFKANGASSVILKRNSDTILSIPIIPFGTGGLSAIFSASIGGVNRDISYHAAGDPTNFVIRVNDLIFDGPGTHVYILEVTNAAGARSTERIEIERQVTPYTVLSPKPTVGDRIVVNKNFVHLDIEAEGASQVLIGKDVATYTNPNDTAPARFEYDYIGLKPNKDTVINFDIMRDGKSTKGSITVYYVDTLQVDSQFMMPLSTKHTVFGGDIALTFPKGTVLKSKYLDTFTGTTKYYTDKNIRFGIADPNTGILGKRDDYNNVPNVIASTQARFTDSTPRIHFTRVSPAYWISGGLGEYGTIGNSGYLPAKNGLTPYTYSSDSGESFGYYMEDRKIIPTNRGKLTLAFNDNVVNASASNVAVMFLDDSNRWVNLGGEVNSKNNTISVPFDNFGYYMVVTLKLGFSDITNHPWARNVLSGLYSKGIMTNLRSSEFGTEDFITRGEFATIVVKSLNIPLDYDANNTFVDVPTLSTDNAANPTWDYKYIETAARAGIISGLDNGFYGVTQRITREEAALIITRALQLKKPINDAKLEASLAKTFVDAGNIAFYARTSVEAVYKAKIMVGNSATVAGEKKPVVSFIPKANLSRAEAGVIAVKMLQKSTNIFPKDLN